MRQDIPIKQILCRKAAALKIPITGAFELTPRCSLNCKMCYIRMTPEEMRSIGQELTVDQWLHLGEEAKKAGALFLLLTGGEPFLRTDFREIYTGLAQQGFSLEINTNGTLLDEKTLSWLSQSPPGKINVTLYGACRESYGSLCGVPEAYDKVKQGIDLLLQAGILVSLSATITPQNAQDADAIVDFAKERELNLRLTSYVYPPCRKPAPGTVQRLSPQEAGALSAKAQLRYWGEAVMSKRMEKNSAGETDVICPDECIKTDAKTGLPCLAGNSNFWVTWDGRLTPCCMIPWIHEDPFRPGFARAWQHVTQETAKLKRATACSTCRLRDFCPSCAAINYYETGATDQCPQYLCDLTQSYCSTLRKALD